MKVIKVVYHFVCLDVYGYQGNVMLQNARAIFNRQFGGYDFEKLQLYRD